MPNDVSRIDTSYAAGEGIPAEEAQAPAQEQVARVGEEFLSEIKESDLMTDAKLLSAEMVDIQGVPTARILLSYVFSRDNIQCYKAYYYYYLSDGGHFMCILYDSTGDGSWLDAFDESAQSIRFINP